MAESINYNVAHAGSLPNATYNLIQKVLQKEVFTCILGKVKKLYTENEYATADIELMNIFLDDQQKEAEPLTIYNALIGLPYVKDWHFNLPIKEDDVGLCLISKYDLTNYKKTNSQTLTRSANQFNLSDAIFLPLSLCNQKEINDNIHLKKIEDDTDKVSIEITPDNTFKLNIEDKSMIEIKNDGKIKIENDSGDSLELTTQGLLFKDNAGNSFETKSTGFTIKDPMGSTIETSPAGMDIKDSLGNDIKMTPAGIVIKGAGAVSINGKLTIA